MELAVFGFQQVVTFSLFPENVIIWQQMKTKTSE